jgi:hypothetical protein
MSNVLDATVHRIESVTQVRGETMAFRRPTSGIADPYDIVDHGIDRTGVQCEDDRLVRHGAKGVMQLIWRNGADVAEVLR